MRQAQQDYGTMGGVGEVYYAFFTVQLGAAKEAKIVDLAIEFPDYEIIVRRDGADIMAVALFHRTPDRTDVVVGYPSLEIKANCADLLIEIGQHLNDSNWKSVPDVGLSDAPGGDGDGLDDIPF